jgi:Domain of unknown function (DUF4112)
MSHSHERLRRLAWLLDDVIRVPGTRIRFGLDPLIGLIPGLGDVLGAIVSSYIVVEAARQGIPRSTLLRMAWNVLLEAAIGVIPLVGDLFDAGWKANQRNVALLERYLTDPTVARSRDRAFLAAIFVGGAGLLGVILASGYWLLSWLFSL